jgi:hypothetical protein
LLTPPTKQPDAGQTAGLSSSPPQPPGILVDIIHALLVDVRTREGGVG